MAKRSGARDSSTLDVYLEVGAKKVFACALDWPGWSRAGKTEEQALEALLDYAERYAPVAAVAGLDFDAAQVAPRVLERVPGDATTDFGAPGRIPELDRRPLDTAEAGRLAEIVQGCWQVFDKVVAEAPPQLRKGPRGGGRDRDKIVEHVLAAERAYARKLGVTFRQPAIGDAVALAEARASLVRALAHPSAEVDRWPVRYAARRIAWHVLDHAWEIEDRSES